MHDASLSVLHQETQACFMQLLYPSLLRTVQTAHIILMWVGYDAAARATTACMPVKLIVRTCARLKVRAHFSAHFSAAVPTADLMCAPTLRLQAVK